jgi:hypothetical protein
MALGKIFMDPFNGRTLHLSCSEGEIEDLYRALSRALNTDEHPTPWIFELCDKINPQPVPAATTREFR